MQKTASGGFTLIELLFVVAIGMMIITVGVPSFTNLVKNSRMTASVNDVVTAMQLSRSEASKRGVAVTLCPSTNANSEAAANCGGDWHDGFIAFVDPNANGQRDNGDELLRAEGPAAGQLTVNASNSLAAGITYGGDGFPIALADEPSNLVFCGDPDNADRARILNVSSTGRPMARRNAAIPSGLQCTES